MTDDRRFTLSVQEDSDQRLDAFVSAHVGECSRSMAADLIRGGLIRVGVETKKPGYRLKPGEVIQGRIPPPEPTSYEPEPIPLDILHEDGDIIVINKAPGLVVHPAPGHKTGTLVNGLLQHCPDLEGIGGQLRPGIVHRLDKDTSGLLVVAKNGPSLAGLAEQFKFRKVQKQYLALVHGETATESGAISLAIGRHPVDRKRMSTVTKNGKSARTLWRVKARYLEATLLEVNLQTGRTHQIRVHCAAVQHPIVGDPVYGSRGGKRRSNEVSLLLKTATRQMLHAWRIRFRHPKTGVSMSFECPPPHDMELIIDHLQSLTENDTSWRD